MPRIIGCAENHPKHIALPRGCLDDVIALLSTNQIELKLNHECGMGQPLQARFNGELRGDQQKALNAIPHHQFGMLVAPTAFGKTVVAAALIAQRQVSTLILVHRKELMLQWQERLSSFLTLETGKIGVVGSGKNNPTGLLDVGIIQSLTRRDNLAEFLSQYGQIIVDEAHHLSAQSFESVLKTANVQYVLGLSATPTRSDGHHPIIFMQCGPIRHRAKRPLHIPQKLTVRVQYLSAPLTPSDARIQDVIQALVTDHARNMQIIEDAIAALKMGRKVLLLTKRTDHLHLLNDYLQNLNYPIFILHGKMKAKDRQTVLDSLKQLPSDAPHLLLASAQLVGEGFDHAPLDTLIIALPISWQGTLQQYVGRLHREHIGKTDVLVHDYAELDHPQLARMWDKRQRGYKAMGYQINNQDQDKRQGRIPLFAE